MERAHHNRPGRSRGLRIALVCLELAAQIITLSLLPSFGLEGILSLSDVRVAALRDDGFVRFASCLEWRFMQDRLIFPQSEDLDPSDDDQEQAVWPPIEMLLRQKALSST